MPLHFRVDGQLMANAFLTKRQRKHSDLLGNENHYALPEKFAEELNKMGINLSVSDGRYNFDTDEE